MLGTSAASRGGRCYGSVRDFYLAAWRAPGLRLAESLNPYWDRDDKLWK